MIETYYQLYILFSKVKGSPSEDPCGAFVHGRLEELETSTTVDSQQLFSCITEIIILLSVYMISVTHLHWHLLLHEYDDINCATCTYYFIFIAQIKSIDLYY